MAEAVLSAFLQVAFQNLLDAFKGELRLQLGLEKELEDLMKTVEMVKAVPIFAERRQHDEALDFLAELREFTYKAMDVLDEYSTEALRQNVISFQEIRNTGLNPKRAFFRHKVSHEVKAIKEEMKNIAERLKMSGMMIQGVRSRHREGSSHHEVLQPTTALNPSTVFGRDDDAKKIVSMLVSPNDVTAKNSISIITILGVPGVGKTTVAQLVYNDKVVLEHFEMTLWVHVSLNFNRRLIIKSIIESVELSLHDRINLDVQQEHLGKLGSINLDVLQEYLRKKLRGRRYLLVLDDLWNESAEDWEWLSRPLQYGAKGSKILLTTRSELVAKTVANSFTSFPYQYHLHHLSDDACWSLFCEKVIGQSHHTSSDLYKFREEVVKKCNGIPLHAISIGHRLHLQTDKEAWEGILQNDTWDFSGINSMSAVKLSYDMLLSHLKPCFAYCSIVPKGFPLEKQLIIQFWMAQRFIPHGETGQMEDIGSNYFDSLVQRSFLQSIPNYDRSRYSIDDTMYDLARHVSAEECCVLELGSPHNPPAKARHLTFNCGQDECSKTNEANSSIQSIFKQAYGCKGLYTLLLLGGSPNYQLTVPDNLANKLGSLRTLDLSDFGLSALPKSIGNLKHLRCLQLRNTKIRRLPKSVDELYNLQTLGLRNCYYLEALPKRTNRLRKLRHLDLHLDDYTKILAPRPLPAVYHLGPMPEEIGLLNELRTLSRFVIGTSSRCGISELKNLNNLHGELLILNLDLVKHANEAADAEITAKKFIDRLEFFWRNPKVNGSNSQDTSFEKDVLANLRPHTNLKELKVTGYGASAFPSWIGDASFSKLVTLRLSDCKECATLPPLGQLSLLKYLYITGLDAVATVDCAFCGSGSVSFPSLEKLHFERMIGLKEWCGKDSCAIHSLRELVIKECVNLWQFSHNLPSLTKLTVEGSPNLIGIHRFQSLKYLQVKRNGAWIVDSWPNLATLFELKLSGLPATTLPLEIPWIQTSMQHLEISHFDELLSFPDDCLPGGLTYLAIKHCPRISALPKGLQALKALEDLDIQHCRQLQYLPELEDLASLIRLEISDCPSLWSLPHLPTALQFLSINNCPALIHRCKHEGKPDHGKIKRIFSVWLDGQQVSSPADFQSRP